MVDDNEPDRFVIERDGQAPLCFDGYFLGSATSRTDEKDRWTEINIYVTEGGKFVSHVAGMSRLPGEVVRNSVSVHESAANMIKGLARRSGLSFVARQALLEAAEMDDDVADALKPSEPEYID